MTPVSIQEQIFEENLAVKPVAKQLLKSVMLLHVINVTLQFHLYESSVKYLLMWALSSGISVTRRVH